MNLDYETMINQFSQVVWPFWRITGLFLTLPVISSTLVPLRIRLVFSAVLAFLVSPFISTEVSFLQFNGQHLIWVLYELLFGMMMGFVIQLVFQVFIIGGQLLSMQAGLGFATMVDPSTRASVPLVSQFYMMMVTLLFLTLNGHLAVLEALLGSFQIMPIGHLQWELSDLGRVFHFSGWMLKESVLLSLPAILSLLIINLSFGVMTRMAPQLNIFSLGFPITLLMGMVVLYLTVSSVSGQFADCLLQGMTLIRGLIR